MEWNFVSSKMAVINRYNVDYLGYTFQLTREMYGAGQGGELITVRYDGQEVGSADSVTGAEGVIEEFVRFDQSDEETEEEPSDDNDDFPLYLEYPSENDPAQWETGSDGSYIY